jgi:hypothetical protein
MRLRRRGANQPTGPNCELCRCKNGSKKELGCTCTEARVNHYQIVINISRTVPSEPRFRPILVAKPL